MRACLLLVGGLLASACGTAPAPSAPLTVGRDLPDYRPETAAACNAERLSVGLGLNGAVTVNGVASTQDGLAAAAARKNAACANAPAMVTLSIASGVPPREADAIRQTLAGAIVNLTLVEF